MYVLVYVVAVLSVSVLMDVQWDTQTRLGRRILSELMVDFRKKQLIEVRHTTAFYEIK